jgi:hypothetical protein
MGMIGVHFTRAPFDSTPRLAESRFYFQSSKSVKANPWRVFPLGCIAKSATVTDDGGDPSSRRNREQRRNSTAALP